MYQLCLKNIDSVLWTIQSEGIHSVKILEVFSRCYLNAFRVTFQKTFWVESENPEIVIFFPAKRGRN